MTPTPCWRAAERMSRGRGPVTGMQQVAGGVQQVRHALGDRRGPAVAERLDDRVRLVDGGDPPGADPAPADEIFERRPDGFGEQAGGGHPGGARRGLCHDRIVQQ